MPRRVIQPQRANVPAQIGGRHFVAPVDAGVDGRARIQLHQVFQDGFGAAHLIEPIVNESNFHESRNESQ